jgi:hypothetical protein
MPASLQGADILSKWVGEAERQLRLLFEEAQTLGQQPSIIFFDEIDGLAPVSDRCAWSTVTLLVTVCVPACARSQLYVLVPHAPVCCITAAPQPPKLKGLRWWHHPTHAVLPHQPTALPLPCHASTRCAVAGRTRSTTPSCPRCWR